jgi:hypothetical protein
VRAPRHDDVADVLVLLVVELAATAFGSPP